MSRKFSVSLILMLLLFGVSAFAQPSLRIAMDQDQDGKADLGIFRPSNNVWYFAKSSGGVNIQTFGIASTDYMTPGDYDGDGKGDIAIWRDPDGLWYFLRSSNGTVGGMAWGISGDEPAARNYYSDNITDFAVVRRTGGSMIWYIFNSATSSFRAEGWGLSTDYTAPGDYDGDGKFDIAVVREGATPSAGLQWYIRKSSDGGLLGVVFGITGTDINAQNDYDGDGKCDPAVWSDTTGTFFVDLSTTNYTQLSANVWGVSGDYPVARSEEHT